ncbi:MAG: histidine ammonia-lyase [Chloroflexi bacterium]|nr:histidine ammonia-lyase [Chloroflexota bacterium]
MEILRLTGNDLSLQDIWTVAVEGRQVSLHPETLERVSRSRAAVETLIARDAVVYGISTGFGHLKNVRISNADLATLQRNLVRSHAAGVGPELPQEVSRAMMLVRANTLAKGFSGVRLEVIQMLLDMLNAGVHPAIPAQGSLGSSGDLVPLAHQALVLMGEGEAWVGGGKLVGQEALARAHLPPLVLQAKEGLALTNGTALMAGMGALITLRASALAELADAAAALSLEALEGSLQPFDSRLQSARPHPRQIEAAAHVRRLLAGSCLLRVDRPDQPSARVQDAYSLRCVPQVHGAAQDAIAYARWALEIEINSATDNPLVFWEAGEPVALSGGNFHGELMALSMDYLKIALTELGNISERRTNRLVDENINDGLLPAFLAAHPGLNSGFMIAQYTAAALASENKVLAHPASADTIPTSADTEDHNSMGATATRQAGDILRNLEAIIAIEILTACQAMDFRLRPHQEEAGAACETKLGQGTQALYRTVRQVVPFVEEDRPLAPLIETVRQMIANGHLLRQMEAALV